MFFKKMWFTAFLLVITMVTATAGDNITMKLNATYGTTNFHTLGAIDFAQLVEEYTGGKVKIEVFPAGAFGYKETKLLKVVRDGQVPMSDILMGMVAESEHVFGISSLPRLVNNYEQARALYEACKPLYEKAAIKWNQKFLYAAPWSPSGIASKKKINPIVDLKRLKTRTYDKNGTDFLNKLGIDAVPIPWEDVYSSLRTGKINSVLTSAESAKEGKFWEVLICFTKINYAYALNMVTINLDYWKGLSGDQQSAVLKAASETEDALWQNSKNRYQESLDSIKQKGMSIWEEDPQVSEELNNAARKVIDNFMTAADDHTRAVLKPFIKNR
jgi:TRAP-type C4-dicarboxylate transport system substrate-binding protein